MAGHRGCETVHNHERHFAAAHNAEHLCATFRAQASRLGLVVEQPLGWVTSTVVILRTFEPVPKCVVLDTHTCRNSEDALGTRDAIALLAVHIDRGTARQHHLNACKL